MQNRDEKVCPESQNVLIQGTGASEWKRPWGARLMPIPKRGSRASAAEGKGSTQVQAASDQTGIFFITQIYFITRSRSPSPRRLVLVCTERELIKTSRLQLWLYIRIMWELLKSPWANQIRFSWCGTQVFFKAPW